MRLSLYSYNLGYKFAILLETKKKLFVWNLFKHPFPKWRIQNAKNPK